MRFKSQIKDLKFSFLQLPIRLLRAAGQNLVVSPRHRPHSPITGLLKSDPIALHQLLPHLRRQIARRVQAA